MDLIYFNTVNEIKMAEIREIFKDLSDKIRFMNYPIMEILSHDLDSVIRAKAKEAYKLCKIPIIVEHGALCIDYLNGYPGALSKPMWDLLGDNICKLIPRGETRSATAYSAVCYCNGLRRLVFKEKTEGSISIKGRGDNGFQWDPIFIPHGSENTYAQMPVAEKLQHSQANKAYQQLRTRLGL